MKKEKFTNATVFYNNSGEPQHVFCTNRNLTKTLNKLQKCSWITDINVVKYDFSEDQEEIQDENIKEENTSLKDKLKEVYGNTITATKVDDRVIFTNIWTNKLRCKVAYISSDERFTGLLELNRTYTIQELYKLGLDNNIYEGTLEAIKYLEEA